MELQQEIFSLRMLPLELVLGSLPKMVEETTMLLGKEVDFSVSGGDVMIDKIILESLNDPLIHLVRNAIDHGTVEGFFVRCAAEKFLIPSTFVKEVLVVKQSQHVHLGQKEAIRLRDKIIPIYDLAAILWKDGQHAVQDKHFVLVVESVGNEIGIVVDAILQYDALIYKPLPPNLSKLNLLQGIVFDESYKIINILFVPAQMERFKFLRPQAKTAKTAKVEAAQARQTVLVVDDSYSTREIECSICEKIMKF